MRKHKLLAGILAAALVVTSFPASLLPADKAKAAVTPVETTIQKTEVSNPVLGEKDGNLLYGGDPSILVDGDTIYLYTGRDASQTEAYFMPDWQCYSTKDLKNWKYEGVIMKGDKESITWANTGTDAWAGQIEKYNGKYYFYYCTWDSTSAGKQSIGVATSNSPTGPFTDIGQPLVKGDITTPETSGWNDIDPTVWVETDEKGDEHRYLSWGNGKVFVCELNENMTSIKDVNGDGKITFGIQANGATSKNADIIEKDVAGLTFTEAPWIYRRKNAEGKVTGPYYLFYAWGWREEMAYATTNNLMDEKLTFGKKLMPPTATSNTNHPAVFDWKGKTYFVYHNGSLPGGSGFRRTACITELHFNADGSIQEIPESAIGICDNKAYTLYNGGDIISHENFINSSADGDYPYKKIKVGKYLDPKAEDTEWAIVAGKSVPENGNADAYVSIQSNNKPGLYLTANSDKTVTLAQDSEYSATGDRLNPVYQANQANAKAQTFRTVKGLSGVENTYSFESVSTPGFFLSVSKGQLALTDGSNAATATFAFDATTVTPVTGSAVDTSISSLTSGSYKVAVKDNTYSFTVPADAKTATVNITLKDSLAYAVIDGMKLASKDSFDIALENRVTTKTLTVCAADGKTKKDYTITVSKPAPPSTPVYNTNLFKTFTFENQTNGAIAMNHDDAKTSVNAVSNPAYKYVDGVKGKAIYLDGTYGLKLCDSAKIGNTYSISFWMKPDAIQAGVDPTLAGGIFDPQYWFNLSFGNGVWSNNGGYVDNNTPALSYTAGKWQHVTLTVDGTKAGSAANTHKAKLYLNGELKLDGDIAANVLTQTGAALYFGVNRWDACFAGTLDEIAIFSRVLSATEVASIANGSTDVTKIAASTDPNKKVDPPKPPASTATVKKVTVKAANRKPGSKTVYLKKGGKVSLAATVTGTGSFSKGVTWKTSKKKVATVTSKGVVKAKAKGTAKITAVSKTDNKKKATITIKVSKKAVKNKKLKLKKTKLTLKRKKSYTIGIKSMTTKTTESITYKSSKKSVATVDKYGVVKAKKKGKATITVKCGKKKAKLKLTVKK